MPKEKKVECKPSEHNFLKAGITEHSELEKLRLPDITAPLHKEQLRKHLINTYIIGRKKAGKNFKVK